MGYPENLISEDILRDRQTNAGKAPWTYAIENYRGGDVEECQKEFVVIRDAHGWVVAFTQFEIDAKLITALRNQYSGGGDA